MSEYSKILLRRIEDADTSANINRLSTALEKGEPVVDLIGNYLYIGGSSVDGTEANTRTSLGDIQPIKSSYANGAYRLVDSGNQTTTNTNVGSGTEPVYFSDGRPCVATGNLKVQGITGTANYADRITSFTDNDGGDNANVNFTIGTADAEGTGAHTYSKTINNVNNVTTNINGHLINDIFEDDGTSVKEATHADVASNTYYKKASSSGATISAINATYINAVNFTKNDDTTFDISITFGNGNTKTIANDITGVYTNSATWNEGTTSGPTLSLVRSDGAQTITTSAFPSASACYSGVVTTDSQTFAGGKEFLDHVLFSDTVQFNNRVELNTVGSDPTNVVLNAWGRVRMLTGTAIEFTGSNTSLSAEAGGIYCGGNFRATNLNASAVYTTSDIRKKENLSDYLMLDKSIIDIPVKEYNYIGEEEKRIGFIAQDLQKVFPELVSEDDSPEKYLSIDTSRIVFYLIAELKKYKPILDKLLKEFPVEE